MRKTECRINMVSRVKIENKNFCVKDVAVVTRLDKSNQVLLEIVV